MSAFDEAAPTRPVKTEAASTRPEDEVDARPFDLGEPEARHAVLCLHGLTGTPYEVRSLGEAAAARGWRAVGPALPGHARSPEELARVSFDEWLGAARDAVEDLRRRHVTVMVAGLSMGGLLTLALASEQRAAAIAVIGTPLRLRPPIPQLVGIAKHFKPFLAKKGGSDIRDPAARARHPGYPVMPLASVHELVRLQRWVDRRLSGVRVPTLVAHGAHDGTAAPEDARVLNRRIAGSELLMLENSGHVVPVDHDGERLAGAVGGFFERSV